MPSFEIADCPTSLPLTPGAGGQLRGTLTLSVRNATDRTRTGRVRVEPGPTAKPEWLKVDTAPDTSPRELSLDFGPRATQTVKIDVAVPAGTAGGDHLVRVLALAESDTDDDVAKSGDVAFKVPEPKKADPAPVKKFPWAIAAIAAAAVLLVGGVIAFFLLTGGSNQPNLAGKSLSEAKADLAQLGYGEDKVRSVPGAPDGKTPGTVLASLYSPDGTVELRLDPGVTVPELAGEALDRAKADLAAAKLRAGTVSEQQAAGRPGSVISSAPPSGTVVASETEVSLTVIGSRPQPPVVDLPEAAARQRLHEVGYTDEDIRSGAGAPSGKDPGTVIAADYRPDGSVTLRLDPGVRVPPVAGSDPLSAVRALTNAGFAVGALQSQSSVIQMFGKVVGTDPSEGSMARSGSPVTVLVGDRLRFGPVMVRPELELELKRIVPNLKGLQVQ